jgi:hypothetical protein
MLRLNSNIDRTMAEWFARLRTLPPREQHAVTEAIRWGIAHDQIPDIPEALLEANPVLFGLWSQWREALETEAWRAVIVTVFETPEDKLCRLAAATAAEKEGL